MLVSILSLQNLFGGGVWDANLYKIMCRDRTVSKDFIRI